MNSTPPEANTEYSRAPRPSRGRLPGGRTGDSRALELHGTRVPSVIAVGGLLAALVLVVAEFTRLFTVFEVGRAAAVRTVATGSHHDFALLPIAALVVVLMVATRRGGGRPALVALAALGILVLVIALLVDLPDAHRTGLIAFGRGFELGRVTPSVGFYLETLAGVLLLIVSGMGLMVGAGSGGRGRGGGRPGGPGAPGRAGQDRPARPRL